MSGTYRRRVGAAAAAALAAVVVAGTAVPSLAAASPAPAPTCAWRYAANPGAINAGLPDTNAVYWVMPYTVRAGLRIVLAGNYADARYISFTAYTNQLAPFTADGVGSELTDDAIAPDPGSVNPWQHHAAPGGAYTVTLTGDASTGGSNVLPIAPPDTPSGTTGYLIYRVYLPANGVAGVPLPAVTVDVNGVSTTVPVCSGAERGSTLPTPGATAAPAATGATAAPAATGPTFARGTSSTGSLFPNPDNGYLSAQVTPPTGNDVVVIRAKAPTTPPGDDPNPWPSNAEVRYYSLCADLTIPPLPAVINTLPDGTTDDGCRADTQTILDGSGYYTYAVGTEAQRAAIEAVPGVTFVPFSSAHPTSPHVLFLRNLLGNFPEAIQQVPADNQPATAQAVMKEYYPVAALCPLATLTAGGPAACVG